MKLPTKFSSGIVEHSNTATKYRINNTASPEVLKDAETFYTTILVPLRIRLSIKFGRPIEMYVNSWYRCPELNSLVKGKNDSQHLKGWAADTYVIGIGFDEYYNAVKKLILDKKLPIDQCIKEYGKRPETNDDDWVHISYNPYGLNRGDLFIKEPGQPYKRDLVS